MEKVYFHTVITVPKGRYIAPYSRATAEIDSFAKSENTVVSGMTADKMTRGAK